MDDKTRNILTGFFRDIRQLPNECAKRVRFAALLGELFPGSKAVTKFPEGTEKIAEDDRVVCVSTSAQGEAEALIKKRELPASLARRRAAVREHVKEILEEIDAIVRALI